MRIICYKIKVKFIILPCLLCKMKKRRYINKKADTIVFETVIFIVLNIIFFLSMLAFAISSGSRDFIYEQSYAKQIALLIDNAKPDMVIFVDIKDMIKLAEKNNKPLDKVFTIDEKQNRVKVSLESKGGYSYQYFSGYSVNLTVSNDILLIKVND